jgi:hypothetical protein
MSRFPRLLLFGSLARLVYPTFGPRPIEAINRSDIVRLLDQIEDERGQVIANQTLAFEALAAQVQRIIDPQPNVVAIRR